MHYRGLVRGRAFVGLLGLWLWSAAAADAATIQVNTTAEDPAATNAGCSLREAIIAANRAAARGGCPAGDPGGQNTLVLQPHATYTLTQPDQPETGFFDRASWYGPDGLPPIASSILIEGNGATIARSGGAGAPFFRLFFVGANPLSPDTVGYVTPGAGTLTLRDVTLTGGYAKGGDSHPMGGGGGAGMGGAIFSQGTVVIERSTLSGNTAAGGAANNPSAGYSGGGIGSDSIPGGGGGGFGPGNFGGGSGGAGGTSGGGGGAGFAGGETGQSGSSGGAGGGPRTGLGADGSNGGSGGDGSGGGGATATHGQNGGGFGRGGGGTSDSGGGGGVGGGGGDSNSAGGGGFGGGGGEGLDLGGSSGGFGGGGAPGGAPGFGGGSANTTTSAGGGGAGMGGAIFNMQGSLTIVNSTLTANRAVGGASDPSVTDPGKGIAGAVFNLNGTFTATSSTFAANAASHYASQILNLAYDGHSPRLAQTTLFNSIVADGIGTVPGVGTVDLASDKSAYFAPGLSNKASDDADISHTNLVRSTSTMIAPGETGTITGPPLSTADPLLSSPAFNGGPGMQTMALQQASPALGIGLGCPAVDERGVTRPAGLCDLGAYQLSAAQLSGLHVSPPRFSLGGRKIRGRCLKLTTANRADSKCRRPIRLTISFVLTAPTAVTLTIGRVTSGRRIKGRCVQKTRKNHKRPKCTRLVALHGAITLAGKAGANSHTFTGQIGGRKLGPAVYQLTATPAGGTPQTVTFKLVA